MSDGIFTESEAWADDSPSVVADSLKGLIERKESAEIIFADLIRWADSPDVRDSTPLYRIVDRAREFLKAKK